MPLIRVGWGMLRNGLEQRSREKKVGLWVGGISSFFLISFFLVPFYLPENSVPELSGRANAFDYHSEDSWGNVQNDAKGGMGHNQSEHGTFVWSDLDPYAAFIYAFGDLNCHTKAERSWEINGNQMPVCVRDVGIFLGLAIGGFLFARFGVNRWTIRDTFLSLIPDSKMESVYKNNRRLLAMLAIAAIDSSSYGNRRIYSVIDLLRIYCNDEVTYRYTLWSFGGSFHVSFIRCPTSTFRIGSFKSNATLW